MPEVTDGKAAGACGCGEVVSGEEGGEEGFMGKVSHAPSHSTQILHSFNCCFWHTAVSALLEFLKIYLSKIQTKREFLTTSMFKITLSPNPI